MFDSLINISYMSFSVLDHLIVFGDEKGCMAVWNTSLGSTSRYFPDGAHQQISCVVCSPYYQQLVAVGYKSGAVSIVDINNKGMVSTLKHLLKFINKGGLPFKYHKQLCVDETVLRWFSFVAELQCL